MGKKNNSGQPDNSIAANRSAFHDFFIEDKLEVGLELEGWEVKSLRDKKVQLKESYVTVKNAQLWLFGCHISPLKTVSTHIKPDPLRMRRLLAHRHEIDRLIGQVERKGATLVPLGMHWSKGRAKLMIGLARGKKQHDKRASEKDRDWQRDKARMMQRR